MTNNRPSRQHHITKSYLELFCTELKTKKTFWVYDKERKIWRYSQPLNEAVEHDFQRLDHFIGVDPDYLEKAFADIEGQAIDVIRKMALKKCIPQSLEEFSPVINLMGIFAGRNLATRNVINKLFEQSSLKTLELIHKDEATYYAYMSKVIEGGAIKGPITPYEKPKLFLENRNFKIKTDPSIVVEVMMERAANLTDLLGLQNWMLLEAFEAEFITSNNPVNPLWAFGFVPHIPGYGLFNSVVTFPITPKLALLGSWSPLPNYRQVDYLVVEGVNWTTANSGATILYAQNKSSLPMFEGVSHLQDFHRLLPTRLIEMSKA